MNQLKNENKSLQEQIESVQIEKNNLLSELESANQKYNELQEELKSLEKSIETGEKEKEIDSNDVTIIVTDKGELPEDINNGRFSNYCTMEFQISNNTEKDIQGVEGILEVKDLFGKTIIEMGCDFVGQTIPAKQIIVEDELVYEVNQFSDSDVQFYTTDFEDLKFEYEVTQIVFTDGTKKE